MRTVKINLDSLAQQYDCGYCFESYATTIELLLPNDIYTECEYFTIDFKNTLGDTFITERFLKENLEIKDENYKIIYSIPQALTQREKIFGVVTGYCENDEKIEKIYKSNMFTLLFSQSIYGDENIDEGVIGVENELTKCLSVMKKQTKIVFCEDLLASGTFSTSNSLESVLDTGITINKLREYEHIFINIAGGNSISKINPILGYSDENYGSSSYGFLHLSSIINANVLLSWIDTDKKYYVGKLENSNGINGDDWSSYPTLCYAMFCDGGGNNTSFGNSQIGSIDLKEVDTDIATPLNLDCTLVWKNINCSTDFTWKIYGVMKKELMNNE